MPEAPEIFGPYEAGEELPAWLMASEPTRPDAERGAITFARAAWVVRQRDGGLFLLPCEGAGDVSVLRFDLGRFTLWTAPPAALRVPVLVADLTPRPITAAQHERLTGKPA